MSKSRRYHRYARRRAKRQLLGKGKQSVRPHRRLGKPCRGGRGYASM